MSMPGSITVCIGRLKRGHRSAIDPLWAEYFPRLVGFARQRLHGKSCRMADEEDVALSAFHSFCKAAQAGRFTRLHDRHSLWSLLARLTVRKAVDLLRQETRQKRGGGNLKQETGVNWATIPTHEASPVVATCLMDRLQYLLARLDATGDRQLKHIAELRLEEYANGEIAARLGCTRRSVERKLHLIKRVWQREVQG